LDLILLLSFLSPARVWFAINERDFGTKMNDIEPVTSANKSERTFAAGRERTNVTPHFDSAALQHARPAVPIAKAYSDRRWLPTLIVAAAVAGLTGGVIGSLLTTNILRREDPPQIVSVESPQIKTEDAAPAADTAPPAAREAAPETVPETTGAPHREIIETATGRQPSARDDEAPATKGEEAALRGALNDWVAATNARDIGRQMTFYGPTVNAFYRARNATSELVRAEKEHVFRNADTIDIRVAEPQISVAPDGRSATMRFRKSYAIAGGGQDRRGEVIQELRWLFVDGKWRIVSERDLKVVR
jgi:hypothetical protein